jgi:hypothetical protein
MLYDLSSNKQATVAQIIGYNRYYLTFTGPLNDILHQQLLNLYGLLTDVDLNIEEDIILWRWSFNLYGHHIYLLKLRFFYGW